MALQAPDNTLILTAHAVGVHHLQTLIFNSNAHKVTIFDHIQTWSDFLLQFLKTHLHRAHFADAFLCEYLIFVLMENANPGWLQAQANGSKALHDIHALYQQVKKSFGLHKAQTNFGLPLSDPTIHSVFAKYNSILHQNFFYDEGDLLAINLELLQTPKLAWPLPYHTVILQNIYPLGPGERSFLRLCQSSFPEITWHVFYDEDFSKPSDLLSLAYEDLGNIAQTSDYITAEAAPILTLQETPSPAHEIQRVMTQIAQEQKKGLTYSDIAIVCNSEYAEPLKRQLQLVRLPFRSFFQTKLKELVPFLSDWSKTNPSPQADWPIETKLIWQAIQDLEAQFEFTQNLFLDQAKTVSAAAKAEFFKQHLENAKLPNRASLHQIVVVPFADAIHFTTRKLFVVGLQLESFLNFSETSVLGAFDLSHKEWAEPLSLPQYQFRIRFAKLEQLLSGAKHLVLSRSLTDFSGRTTTPLPTLQFKILPWQEQQKQATQAAKQHATVFFSKDVFSLTELQRYRDCPYKYFATDVLGLKTSETESVDPNAKTLGILLHSILHNLVQEHQPEYLRYLKKDLSLEAWNKTLDLVIAQHTRALPELKNKPAHVVASLIKKTRQSVLNFHQQEQAWLQDEIKLTLPQLAEWPFRLPLQNITVTGRIDRIDTNTEKSFFTVLDYKTGSQPSAPDMKNGRDLQIPTYLLAVEELLYPQALPSAGLYYSLKKETASQLAFSETCDAKLSKKHLQTSRDEWLNHKQNLKAQILDITQHIQQNDFDPNPVDIKICEYCDFKRMCGKHDIIT